MAASLKTKGKEELDSFKRRVLRQHAMNRIGRAERDWLTEHIEEIERFVTRMSEQPDEEGKLF